MCSLGEQFGTVLVLGKEYFFASRSLGAGWET